MDTPSALTGWLWIKQGWAIFRKQPTELLTMFFGYMFIMLLVGIVPIVGQIIPMILVPVFSLSFMHACAQVERGQRVYPNVLLTGFRSPHVRNLIKLGTLYLLAAVIAVALSSAIDGGLFLQAMSGQIQLDAETVQGSDMTLAMLFAGLLYIPAAMAFWYAAPLIGWQNMGVGKAVFYSFFAVKRAGKAFLVYGLAWATVGVIFPVIFSTLLGALLGSASASLFILLPASLLLTVVMYCSFYPTYTHMFGPPPERLPS